LSPTFSQIEKPNNYELLGGVYIRINDKIYWRGMEVLHVDVNSFKVLNVQRNKSEWQASIGTDGNNLYHGNKIMSHNQFIENYFWKDKDFFEKKYFPKK